MLSRASESIARSHVVAVETEHIGQDTMDELGQQRETLTRTRDRVSVTFLSNQTYLFFSVLCFMLEAC